MSVGPILKKETNDAAQGPASGSQALVETLSLVPLEKQRPRRELDGSEGVFRVPAGVQKLISANTDIEAIHAWLGNVTKGENTPTWKAYRKEAERLLAWAIIECEKPISSLTIEDLNRYPDFLLDPDGDIEFDEKGTRPFRRAHILGVNWLAKRHIKVVDGKTVSTIRRWRRDQPEWRPFDDNLAPQSVDYAMRVLKSMFTFWNQAGYTLTNQLGLYKKRYAMEIDAGAQERERVLDRDTWTYLFQFVEINTVNIPPAIAEKVSQKENWLRRWHRARTVLATLYLLGLRISELSHLTMSSFYKEDYVDKNHGVQSRWWVNVIGKGNKQRTIPVPADLIHVINSYRELLNALAPKRTQYTGLWPLSTLPVAREDDTTLIRNLTGTKPLSTNMLAQELRAIFDEAADHALKASPRPNIQIGKLSEATAHWLRHTSATHQSLEGVSLRHLQKTLGHASINTTMIYEHGDLGKWAEDVMGFHLKKDDG